MARFLVLLCCISTAIAAIQRPQTTLSLSPDLGQGFSLEFDRTLQPFSPDIPLNQTPTHRTAVNFEPEGIHLTPWQQTDAGWTVLVSWQTGDSVWDLTANNPQPHDPAQVAAVVQYGLASGQLSEAAQGNDSLVYTNQYAKNSWSDAHTYHSPIIHHAFLQGLQPGAEYFYRVGNDKDGWSQELSFRAPAAVGSFPLRLGVIGDLGMTLNSSKTLELLTRSNPGAILHTGDLSYADDYCSDGTYKDYKKVFCFDNSDQRHWDAWARLTAPLFSRVPFLTCPGNHEPETLVAQDNIAFQAFSARYPGPQDPASLNTNPQWTSTFLDPNNTRKWANSATVQPNNSYFSVDMAGVHVVSLSNYVPYGEDSAMYRWLQQDLAAVNRTLTPWLVVMHHEPPYHTFNYHFKEVEEFRMIYEPLFYQAGVDMVLLGHVHAYERTRPMYNYTVDPCGTIYVVIGNGGNVEGTPGGGERIYMDEAPAAFCNDTSQFGAQYRAATKLVPPLMLPTTISGDYALTYQDGQFCPTSQPEWSAHRELSFGHGVLTLHNSTTATWEYFRNQDEGAAPADSVTITKAPGSCPELRRRRLLNERLA